MEEQTTKETTISLQDLLSVLKRCWILMLVAAIVVGAGLYLVLKLTFQPKYSATSSILCLRTTQAELSTQDVSLSNYLINTYALLIRNREVYQQVRAELGLEMSEKELDQSIKITMESNTLLLYITVTTSDRNLSAAIANSVQSTARDVINQKFGGTESIKENEPAVVPGEHEYANPISKLKVLLAAAVAAILVYAVFFVLFLLDDKISTPEDVREYLGLNTLGVIPNRESTGDAKYGKYYKYRPYGKKYRTSAYYAGGNRKK